MIARRPRIRLHLAAAALAIVAAATAFVGAPSPVGAAFTSDTAGARQSVRAATIEPLTGGTAARDEAGSAKVAWTTPVRSGEAEYEVHRRVGGVEATIEPEIVVDAASTRFVDDLTVPAPRTAAEVTGIDAHQSGGCLVAGDRVFCWGPNTRGIVGDGTTEQRLSPTPVAQLPGTPTAVTVGAEHACALTAEGAVWCWGDNTNVQLGVPGAGSRSLTPVQVPLDGTATSIASGAFHTCAVLSDGSARCWGTNFRGALGDGTFETRADPVAVIGLSAHPITAISAGSAHTCAIASTGTAWCWGENISGQLGTGSPQNTATPIQVPLPATALQVSAGGSHTCMILVDSSVWCWGSNDSGQLGDATTTGHARPEPVEGLRGVFTAVTAGLTHSCAQRDSGDIWCWGNNYFGQLGVGSLTRPATPEPPRAVIALGTRPVTAIAAGSESTCAIAGGVASCWGYGLDGRLGTGKTALTPTPTPIDTAALPAGYACPEGFTAIGGDRCAPQESTPVSYEIAYTVRGWSPPRALQLDALTAFPLSVGTGGWLWDVASPFFDVVLTNPTDKTMTVTVTVPTSYPDGTRFRFFRASNISGWDYTDGVDHASHVIEPGETLPLIRLFWSFTQPGRTVVSYSVAVEGHQPFVEERIVPPR